jgi:predicted transcriptional regulator
MPTFDDVEALQRSRKSAQKKPFVKKEYRPWIVEDSAAAPIGNQLTNDQQTFNNQLAIDSQTIDNHLANNKQPVDKHIANDQQPISNQLATNSQTIGNQLANDLFTDADGVTKEIKRLVGLQKQLLFFIVDNCSERKQLETQPLTRDELESVLNTNGSVINTVVQRLAERKLIKRPEHKTGKGGFRVFIINDEIKNAVIKVKNEEEINKQLTNKLAALANNVNTENKELG